MLLYGLWKLFNHLNNWNQWFGFWEKYKSDSAKAQFPFIFSSVLMHRSIHTIIHFIPKSDNAWTQLFASKVVMFGMLMLQKYCKRHLPHTIPYCPSASQSSREYNDVWCCSCYMKFSWNRVNNAFIHSTLI